MKITPERFKYEFMKNLDEELLIIANRIIANVRANTPVASANLRNSWAEPVSTFGSVSIGSPKWGSYGQYVEFGTKPHWAPLQPLIEWANNVFAVKAVGVDFATGRARPTRRGTIRTPMNERVRFARAVQWAIAKRGTKAKLFVKQAIRSAGFSVESGLPKSEGSELFYEVDLRPWVAKNAQRILEKTLARFA